MIIRARAMTTQHQATISQTNLTTRKIQTPRVTKNTMIIMTKKEAYSDQINIGKMIEDRKNEIDQGLYPLH